MLVDRRCKRNVAVRILFRLVCDAVFRRRTNLWNKWSLASTIVVSNNIIDQEMCDDFCYVAAETYTSNTVFPMLAVRPFQNSQYVVAVAFGNRRYDTC